MFEYIEGQIVGRTPARLVVDVGGVGYDLAVPLTAQCCARRPLAGCSTSATASALTLRPGCAAPGSHSVTSPVARSNAARVFRRRPLAEENHPPNATRSPST
jgi:hypothetical protein